MNKKGVSNTIAIVLVVVILVLGIALIFSYSNKSSEEELLMQILEAEANSKQGGLATLSGDEGAWCDGNDVNRDGFVSFGDVSKVFMAFKLGNYSEIYDVQKDGFISFGDVSKVFTAFKSGNWNGILCSGDTIICYNNTDCGYPTETRYCSDSGAVCVSSSTPFCINPGTYNSHCGISGGGGCTPVCPYGCLNGECIAGNITCTDSDGGKVYSLKGTVASGNISLTDYCITNLTLSEYYCSGNEIASESHTCGNITCSQGRC